ncbi:hypothetical protein L1987_18371 [Smallanthus sonchifolius]|uniref:Uncharacterized protein n=1 Tax=Smallanthus sonchifolius TaxID=185202 RepID=A0ACB9J300_9ASTR|nr:hypothetical protein L1987_18371 [Smallanthus sonchifolius]
MYVRLRISEHPIVCITSVQDIIKKLNEYVKDLNKNIEKILPDENLRWRWDALTGDLELVDSLSGHSGTCTILQFPAIHKKRPPRSGYRRIKINRCVFLRDQESKMWLLFKWKHYQRSKFENSIAYALLNQVSGLKVYISANPALTCESSATLVDTKTLIY